MTLKIDPGKGSETQPKRPKSGQRRRRRQRDREYREQALVDLVASSAATGMPDVSGVYLGPVTR